MEPVSPFKSYSYQDAISLANGEIENKPHGFVKQLCKENKLTYHSVIGLVNNTLAYQTPKLLCNLLIALGYEARLTKDMVSRGDGTFMQYSTYILRKPYPPLPALLDVLYLSGH